MKKLAIFALILAVIGAVVYFKAPSAENIVKTVVHKYRQPGYRHRGLTSAASSGSDQRRSGNQRSEPLPTLKITVSPIS